ncbi:helix-turn-helix transcriptional regulator [Cellulomonas sp. KRMCY2]|uniref:helix-turn-helix transcriptional regulator n=1 Tax=Cellulomonas sp. KRMCY2 TaxID=1304865 RepID=UPI00045E6E6F|nr:helix-turn-helix transcriptional regulator [Cellulomonas sp. KRMCY2]
MGMKQVYLRWLELAAGVLAQPVGTDPTVPVCRALADDFHAAAAVAIASGHDCTTLRPLGPRCPQPLDVGFYARHALDAPVLRHFLARPYDQQVRCSQEVDPCDGDRASGLVVGRLRADRLDQCLVFPVPSLGDRGPLWLVVARSEPFSERELLLARRVHPLVVGLERYAACVRPAAAGQQPVDSTVTHGRVPAVRSLAAPGLLDTVPPQPQPQPQLRSRSQLSPLAPPSPLAQPLTNREHAVLALMAEGLIAQAIGHRLGVSPRTVAKHQERIYRKLDTSDRLTTVLRAQAAGLVGAGARTGERPATGRRGPDR